LLEGVEGVEGVEKLKWLQGWLIEILFFEKIGFPGFRVARCWDSRLYGNACRNPVFSKKGIWSG
jgi:hypothetical protein